MFSVVIPLYNKACYVEKAVLSVLSQTFTEYELIIVNDGSKDNFKEVLERIDLKNTDYRLINQANAGVSSARNIGVQSSKYPYIAFLDADDWWEPTYLEEMSLLVKEYPEGGIYGSSYYLVKNENKRIAPIGLKPGFKSGEINYYQVYAETLCMPLWTGAVVVPKECFLEQGGFNPVLKLGEDLDLWVRIALKYPVVFINKPLSNYNQDVDVYNRGVAKDKIFQPEVFMTFNLEYLQEEERKNKDLKILLDRLRVMTLSRYRFNNAYPKEVKKVIDEVDFRHVSRYYYNLYHFPVLVVKGWYSVLKLGSYLKKSIIK